MKNFTLLQIKNLTKMNLKKMYLKNLDYIQKELKLDIFFILETNTQNR